MTRFDNEENNSFDQSEIKSKKPIDEKSKLNLTEEQQPKNSLNKDIPRSKVI